MVCRMLFACRLQVGKERRTWYHERLYQLVPIFHLLFGEQEDHRCHPVKRRTMLKLESQKFFNYTYFTGILLTICITCTKEGIKDLFVMTRCVEHFLANAVLYNWNLEKRKRKMFFNYSNLFNKGSVFFCLCFCVLFNDDDFSKLW